MSVATVSGSATNYVYNALGQLIEKSGSGGTTLFVYDEADHLLGEYSSTGALIEETIWLGDLPVATIRPSGSTIAIYYVHTDQLGTVRKVTRASDNGLMWRWDPDTFGSVAPNQNPSGLGTFVYNLRFPGQYYQAEMGLNQNYHRDYDPAVGRYIESDPVGLYGGSYSTYAYALSNPVDNSDSPGLWVKLCARWLGNSQSPSTTRLNPTRHDYLDVSGQSIGLYAGGNFLLGPGQVQRGTEQDRSSCKTICSDPKFDAYVLSAALEIGAPTYCAIASAEFGLSGLIAEAAGARNCQSWARDVLAKAKQNYKAQEECPTCFK